MTASQLIAIETIRILAPRATDVELLVSKMESDEVAQVVAVGSRLQSLTATLHEILQSNQDRRLQDLADAGT